MSVRRWVLVLLAIGLFAGAAVSVLSGPPLPQWSYSHLLAEAAAGQVKTVVVNGSQASVTDSKGRQYSVGLPSDTSALAHHR